jgi:hypothetical protein
MNGGKINEETRLFVGFCCLESTVTGGRYGRMHPATLHGYIAQVPQHVPALSKEEGRIDGRHGVGQV